MSDQVPHDDRKRIERRRAKARQVEKWIRGDLNKKVRPLADSSQNDYATAMTFGTTLVVFTLGGVGLDSWLGTSPLFVLSLAGLGLFAGFVHLVETVSPGTLFPARKKLREQRKQDAEPDEDAPQEDRRDG